MFLVFLPNDLVAISVVNNAPVVTTAARSQIVAKSELTSVIADLRGHKIKKVLIYHVPVRIEAFVSLTGAAVLSRYESKLELICPIRYGKASIVRNFLYSCEATTFSPTIYKFPDIRWVIVLQSKSGKCLHEIDIDGAEPHACVINGVVVGCNNDLVHWIESTGGASMSD